MNQYQIEIYNNLMTLVSTNEAFYMKDQELDGVVYRVFSYRLASYSDFLLPSALECRGIMFKLGDTGQVDSLVSMPMNKFFNVGECPFTIGLDYEDPMQVMLKMDGSLISTYLHNGQLRLKSKTSLSSDHAINAMVYLDRDENKQFKQELVELVMKGYTVNMEYTSPEPSMRIVIGYSVPWLTVLNVRSTLTGEYIDPNKIKAAYASINNHWVQRFTYADYNCDDGQEFLEYVPCLTQIEGFVLQLKTGQLVKIKTDWYRALHFTKDSVNNPRRLFEAVLDETTDDLREMFKDDPESIKAILQMEELVSHLYNNLVKTVEDFHQHWYKEDRKTYAIAGQKYLNKREFGLAMNLYLGKEFSFREQMKKWYADYGIKDTVLEKE